MISIEEQSLALSCMQSAAFEIDVPALVGTYSSLLFRVAHSVLRSRAEAEDVVQDVFVRVIQHKRSLPAVNDMRVYLIRIAWNLAIDRRRRIRPEQMDTIFAESLAARDVPADAALQEAQQIKAVLRAVEKLPKSERHVLLLCALQDLSTAEMAQVMGKSESAVRALLFRARSRLRERLNKGAGA